MSSGLTIPGVTDKYKTNDLVEALMETERIPLKREEASLETYKDQQTAWRDVNQKMSALRTSVKNLYSFENPFSNKIGESSDPDAITVDANRTADYGTFKVDVVHPAKADRFLSGNIEKNMTVPKGRYTFQVGDKTIDYQWKGGKLSDFISGLNKRGGQTVKASTIGISPTKSALLFESLVPGSENRLVLKNAALTFAKSIDMVGDADVESTNLDISSSAIKKLKNPTETNAQEGMPSISASNVTTDGKTITLSPRGGFELDIPDEVKNNPNGVLEFTLTKNDTEDITAELNQRATGPSLPDAGSINFHGIIVANDESKTSAKLPDDSGKKNLIPVSDDDIVFVRNEYGIETKVEDSAVEDDGNGNETYKIKMSDYPGAEALIIRNANTGKELTLTQPKYYDKNSSLGYEAKHPISEAEDAVIKYEGITITRSTNDIDDVIPDVTLHLHEATEKTATITIKPDKESAKDALITFVGQYNQVLAQINILTSNKPEVITELDYLDESEVEKAEKQLGMFMSEFSLTNERTTFQRIVAASYPFTDDAEVTMLSQIGISTNASSGNTGYNASQLRGYLEIDEKKLDSMLESNLELIKNIFGYDTDGDLIIDNGVGYLLDQRLNAWTSTGGIIATKNSSLNTRIESSNKKIASLEEQLEKKESELKQKYANMEGTLNSLESQQNSINNTFNSKK